MFAEHNGRLFMRNIFKFASSGLIASMGLLDSSVAQAGAGGFYLPPNYHPMDNPWKIALTIAVIWIIYRLRGRA
jgi:hypothetical protein